MPRRCGTPYCTRHDGHQGLHSGEMEATHVLVPPWTGRAPEDATARPRGDEHVPHDPMHPRAPSTPTWHTHRYHFPYEGVIYQIDDAGRAISHLLFAADECDPATADIGHLGLSRMGIGVDAPTPECPTGRFWLVPET